MICPSCGENNPEGAPSCSSCGHGLEAWAPTQIGRLPIPASPGSSETTSGSVPEAPAAAVTNAQPSVGVGASSGNVIAGRYKIVSQLGRGGVGVVYRAVDMELGEEIALKVLTISERDPAELDRVRREVKVARNITHPNVIRIYEFGTAGADAFISMQLLPGGTLAQRIDSGVMKIEDAIDVSIGICEGLSAAHELGIVHRDIKPENVLFDNLGRPKVVDFGLARFANATTRTVGFSGTPFYMSPEQDDGGEITVRSDVYSLGVLLFELFTGRLPFVADSLVRLAMMHVKDPPPMPRSIRSELPDEIEDMILRSLEKDPSKRYQSVADLAADLKSWRESSFGPYQALRTGDHPRPKPRTAPPPVRKGRAGDVTKTPILNEDDEVSERSASSRRRDVLPRGESSGETVPGVPRPRPGEETQIRTAPLNQETQIRPLPSLDSPSRSSRAVELRSEKSKMPLFAALGGALAVLLIGLVAGGVFSDKNDIAKPTATATPAPTQTAIAAATETLRVATPAATVTPTSTRSTPIRTPGHTPPPTPIQTATPKPTQVALATPKPTMATAPSRVSLTIFVKPLCNVYIEKQLVNGGSIVPKPTGTWTGPGGKLEIRIEHTRKWSGEIMIDRSQSIEIDANNGQVKSNGKHIGWLR